MKPRDTHSLRSAIRDLAIDLHSKGETSPSAFIVGFHQRHPELVEEFGVYGFDIFLRDEARGIMRKLRRELATDAESLQPNMLDGFEDSDIPAMLPIRRGAKGERRQVWVNRDEATLEDGDEYSRMLKAIANGTIASLVDWEAFWARVRPVLLANPTWNVGQAIRHLNGE